MDFDIFLNAIYKTLLHSLWQGMILAIIVGIIVIGGKKIQSSTRYLLLTAALFTFMGASIYTFSVEMNPRKGSLFSSAVVPSEILNDRQAVIDYPIQAVADRVYEYYDFYLAHFDRIIVFIWFVILCFKLARMFVDLLFIQNLKGSRTRILDQRVEESLQSIIRKMKLKSNIAVFESSIAKTPMIIGVIKPMVLLPIGLATMMPIHQIEAIFAHELAHVKRKDFLVNLFQSLVEIIFFFNPPVIWLSAMIRNEREQCCDDIALKITLNKKEYVNTLVKCMEHKLPAYQVAFSSNKKSVLNRVKRIFGMQSPSLNYLEKFFLGACLVSAIFTSAVLSDKSSYWDNKFVFSAFQDNNTSAYQSDRVDSEGIIQQLKNAYIIPDPENFTVKITNFALYVNGKRQSKKVHDQVMKDYVKGFEHRLHYTITVKTES
ncbi:M56 family metallopeptidase [Algoriphagus sp. D3-2-R+10]|uniref:M56 family metallopeptidase n=1 Tax=Algoriphagus aurantiacus TaxID=3103948 RepID=UPI002B38FF3F|nr:M56 family metallopeptidase [Algoriphagus sp. D3-2-R+10]MEB2774592.1 M56 family metallopeptidase [Algoriphagus sp. D3-2-R+10]